MQLDELRRILEHSFGQDIRWEISGPVAVSGNSTVFRALCSKYAGPLAIKCCHPSAGTADDHLIIQLRERLESGGEYDVSIPVFRLQNEGIIGMEWASGSPLSLLLHRRRLPGYLAESYLNRAGRWLGRFHNTWDLTSIPVPAASRMRSLFLQFAQLEESKRRKLQPVMELMERSVQSVMEIPVTQSGVHGDFKPDNILLSEAKTTGIDIGLGFENAIHLDIAYFIIQLLMLVWRPRCVASGVYRSREALVSSFLDGYSSETGAIPALPLAWMRVREPLNLLLDLSVDPRGGLGKRYLCIQLEREVERSARILAALAPKVQSGSS